jgi:hypothetical protein
MWLRDNICKVSITRESSDGLGENQPNRKSFPLPKFRQEGDVAFAL